MMEWNSISIWDNHSNLNKLQIGGAKMKKILVPVMALVLSASAFAVKIGYVNSEEAFSKFSQTRVVQENLNKEKTRLENEIKQKDVALHKAQLELQSKGSKVTDKEKKEFENQVKTFQKFIQDSQTKLSKEEFTRFKAQLELQSKGSKVTDKEKKEFENQVKTFQKFIQDSQTKLSKEEFTRFQAIEVTLNKAIDEVAKSGKYDYILEAGAVKFGGENVTTQVITTMEKIKK